ncbi:MAG TPA: HEAT repeat domain-containing protein [Planctomycetota bacterium]|jgi:hypothetical protein
MLKPTSLLLCALLLSCLGFAADGTWGESKGGLQSSLSAGELTAGAKFEIRLSLRNQGAAAVTLPAGKDVFGWLFISQQSDEGKKAYFTDKLLVTEGIEWPAELKTDKVVEFKPRDLGEASVYKFEKGLKMSGGYPVAPDGGEFKAAGKLGALMSPGKASGKLFLFFPAKDAPMLLTSNTFEFEITSPDLTKLSPEARKTVVKELLAQFDRDPFGGKAAHERAVKLGKQIVPDLVAAMKEKRPDHSRMWIATTIADIPCPEATAECIALLQDPQSDLRSVIAYHGVKQNDPKLDAALLAAGKKAKGEGFVAYGLLGFMCFRGTVPPEFLEVGLESTDPRARSTVVNVLAGAASEYNVARLKQLTHDKEPRIRATAQKVLDAMNTAAAAGGKQ